MRENQELSSMLETIIREAVPSGPVALLLSGGVDSLSLGFAAESVGLEVQPYTFQLGEQPSADSIASKRASDVMGWPLTLIKVPTGNLEKDFLELSQKWGCRKKTQFECTWPFLYVIPEIKERFVLSGIAADGHFGLSKKAMIHWVKTKDRFDEFRRDYFASPNPAGQVQQKALIESYGKVQVAPYLDPRVFDYFIRFGWNQINRPQQKWLTLTAYPEQFKKVGTRKHANLQLVAKVDRLFETLLASELNRKNRSRVMDLCRDYAS